MTEPQKETFETALEKADMIKVPKRKVKDKGLPPPCEPIKAKVTDYNHRVKIFNDFQARTFTSVTNLGNKFTAEVKDTEEEDQKLAKFVAGVSDAIREFVNIAFERAEIVDLIANQSNFKYLGNFNPDAVFDADLNSLQVGKVFSLVTNVQNSLDKLVKQGGTGAKMGQSVPNSSIDRLEKVFYDFF